MFTSGVYFFRFVSCGSILELLLLLLFMGFFASFKGNAIADIIGDDDRRYFSESLSWMDPTRAVGRIRCYSRLKEDGKTYEYATNIGGTILNINKYAGENRDFEILLTVKHGFYIKDSDNPTGFKQDLNGNFIEYGQCTFYMQDGRAFPIFKTFYQDFDPYIPVKDDIAVVPIFKTDERKMPSLHASVLPDFSENGIPNAMVRSGDMFMNIIAHNKTTKRQMISGRCNIYSHDEIYDPDDRGYSELLEDTYALDCDTENAAGSGGASILTTLGDDNIYRVEHNWCPILEPA